jgi:hypothetical protein
VGSFHNSPSVFRRKLRRRQAIEKVGSTLLWFRLRCRTVERLFEVASFAWTFVRKDLSKRVALCGRWHEISPVVKEGSVQFFCRNDGD